MTSLGHILTLANAKPVPIRSITTPWTLNLKVMTYGECVFTAVTAQNSIEKLNTSADRRLMPSVENVSMGKILNAFLMSFILTYPGLKLIINFIWSMHYLLT